MSRKRSTRLPKRPPVQVTYDFSPPVEKYETPNPVTEDELSVLDNNNLMSVCLRLGIDPKEVLGIDKCVQGGRHKIVGGRDITSYRICCTGGGPRSECKGCPDGPNMPTVGIDVVWCRQCFTWILK